ncbi:MAG: methyltransferase domain-containing protein [Patescibacteria group bacterium]|nr:methyltransferase domain-containing protein [Patescibacteria group bacterium]
MKRFKENYLDIGRELKILDVGGKDVNGTYASLFAEPKWTYNSADMENGKNVDILLADPYNWNNVEDDSYDVVISGQSFEHIEYFWITILQINRVLKNGGLVCIIAPAGGYEHRYPKDCWRYFPDGMKCLADWGKLEVIESKTQWQSENYDDGSDEWKDSMLVCTKLRDTPNLKDMLQTLNWWINLNNASIEKIRKTTTLINDIDPQSFETFQKIQLGKVLRNPHPFPEWYEAISYLLVIYDERPDLQSAFPEVSKEGYLTDLFCWAKNFGIKEDVRLLQYENFYKKFCYK